MNTESDNRRVISSAASSESGETSIDENIDQISPTNLDTKKLQVILNKEATEDELTNAINAIKQVILMTNECSIDKKWLVRYLIELRLRLQEYREAMAESRHLKIKINDISNRTIKGHHLRLQPLLKTGAPPYCDHCTGVIWNVIQAWYLCEDCGYACHFKCMASIVRECAHVVACERGQYELNICPEIDMSVQNYLCAECKTQLIINDWSNIRRCDYNGLHYCIACHWGNSAVIPARVIYKWDFEPRQICQASLQILRVMAKKPIIPLEKLNPRLFSQFQELSLVRRLRQELQGIRKYLVVCRKATDEHLLWKCEKPHLIENVDMYSLQDLVDINSGDLPYKLHILLDTYYNHVKKQCEICQGRGHICEICKNQEVLFPFVINAHVCKTCNAVFHKRCIKRKENQCPRCVRLKKRAEEETNNNMILD